MDGVQRPKRWQHVILWQPLTINDPARTAFSWWNETNRIGWLALFRLVSCLVYQWFHLYVVDFNSNIKTLTTNITESNSYLRTRTTVPHVFWNPWKSKNRRVPAVWSCVSPFVLMWQSRTGTSGSHFRRSKRSKRNEENRKKEKQKEKKIAVVSSLVYPRHCHTFSSSE